jgi:hypothetical protein
MRNLARNVMQDVSFRNTISGMCANPTHNASTVAEKVAVQSGKSSAGKGELWGTVMGKEGVGML